MCSVALNKSPKWCDTLTRLSHTPAQGEEVLHIMQSTPCDVQFQLDRGAAVVYACEHSALDDTPRGAAQQVRRTVVPVYCVLSSKYFPLSAIQRLSIVSRFYRHRHNEWIARCAQRRHREQLFNATAVISATSRTAAALPTPACSSTSLSPAAQSATAASSAPVAFSSPSSSAAARSAATRAATSPTARSPLGTISSFASRNNNT